MVSETQKLQVAIKSAKKRVKQINDMTISDTCELCKVVGRVCRECPITDGYDPEPDYNCGDFVKDLDKIKFQLEDQIETFKTQLKKLKAKKA